MLNLQMQATARAQGTQRVKQLTTSILDILADRNMILKAAFLPLWLGLEGIQVDNQQLRGPQRRHISKFRVVGTRLELGIRTPANNYLFCLVSGKQRDPTNAKKQERELLLGKRTSRALPFEQVSFAPGPRARPGLPNISPRVFVRSGSCVPHESVPEEFCTCTSSVYAG